ncbi:Uu.00g144790.m01.CDS01 [Anthostomella pinea]|uniref:Uu.00g144790.m01.CDS01 n=1 Tax=Anthostomella pinea TaxID=933095 RepID=A0AAI8YLN9_9PEZI|nr:Uu.00g144790.m01.CDS01 [Anthostomella pinea]
MDSEKSFEETDLLREDDVNLDVESRTYPRRKPWTSCIIGLLSLVVALETIWLVLLGTREAPNPALNLYSPANAAVRYNTVKLDADDQNPYVHQKSTDVLDQMWMDLYDFGTVGLSTSEAAQLVDQTKPTPNDPDTYPVMITVFHNIHCLNLIRKALWREDYPDALEMTEFGTVNRTAPKALHIDHCVNSIREAMMCSADITPIPFHTVNETDLHVFPELAATHTCRDFDAIREWARPRQVEAWKMDIQLHDDDV